MQHCGLGTALLRCPVFCYAHQLHVMLPLCQMPDDRCTNVHAQMYRVCMYAILGGLEQESALYLALLHSQDVCHAASPTLCLKLPPADAAVNE